jgi:hypothetical protein
MMFWKVRPMPRPERTCHPIRNLLDVVSLTVNSIPKPTAAMGGPMKKNG